MISEGVDLAEISVVPRQFEIPQKLEMPKDCGKCCCFVCRRQVCCLCVNCAMKKVRLRECRKRQVKLNRARALCVEKIDGLLKKRLNVEATLHETEEQIAMLKIKKDELDKVVKKKEIELEQESEYLLCYSRRQKQLEQRCECQEKVFLNMNKNKHRELKKKVIELASLRQKLAVGIFSQVFPVSICNGTCYNELCKEEETSSKNVNTNGSHKSIHKKNSLPMLYPSHSFTSKITKNQNVCSRTNSDEDLSSKWVILDLPETHETIIRTPVRFSIGGCCVNDNGKYYLKKWLRTGLPEMRVYHSAFAAILNAFQLLDVLSSLFDVFLPLQVSLHDAVLCEKWTDDLFDTDIFKLNLSVFLISCKVGVRKLSLHRPFANLLSLSKAVEDESSLRRVPYPLSTVALEEMDKDYRKLRKWVERETAKDLDGWCVVGIKDNQL